MQLPVHTVQAIRDTITGQLSLYLVCNTEDEIVELITRLNIKHQGFACVAGYMNAVLLGQGD